MRNIVSTVICFLVVIFGIAFLADNIRQKQRQPRQVNDMGKLVPLKGSEPTSYSHQDSKRDFQDASDTAKSSRVYNLKPVNINLPAGETFLYVIPGKKAVEMGLVSHEGDDVYVTSDRVAYWYKPRKITFWGSGSVPHSWKPLLYIQEQ